MGGQSKFGSIVESISNTAVGLLTTLVLSPFIYDLVGMQYTYTQLGMATVLFTAISIIRGYIIRRFFNKKTQ